MLLYALVRFAEAYGLWWERRWAEWLAALSGGIYVPVEIYELSRGVSAIKAAALVLNLCVVAYVLRALWKATVPSNTDLPATLSKPSSASRRENSSVE